MGKSLMEEESVWIFLLLKEPIHQHLEFTWEGQHTHAKTKRERTSIVLGPHATQRDPIHDLDPDPQDAGEVMKATVLSCTYCMWTVPINKSLDCFQCKALIITFYTLFALKCFLVIRTIEPSCTCFIDI